jgi:8-oxo-dGTP pyrophosphatase MutT (NUDIX family)
MELARLNPAFARRLARRKPIQDIEARWPTMRLRQRTYIGDIACPTELTSSVRAVVFKDARVVVVRTRDGGRHVEPGGRVEAGETIEATLRRELREETGWSVGPLRRLGLHHFSPLDEALPTVRSAVSDFLQPLFVTEAAFYDRAGRDMTQIERGARLTPIEHALAELPPHQALLLLAAVKRRRRSV